MAEGGGAGADLNHEGTRTDTKEEIGGRQGLTTDGTDEHGWETGS